MSTQIFKIFTFGLFIFTSFNAQAKDSVNRRKPTELSINEAIDKGMIALEITGAYDPSYYYEVVNKDGVHFGKCMAIILKSKIDSLVILRLDSALNLFRLTVPFKQ